MEFSIIQNDFTHNWDELYNFKNAIDYIFE